MLKGNHISVFKDLKNKGKRLLKNLLWKGCMLVMIGGCFSNITYGEMIDQNRQISQFIDDYMTHEIQERHIVGASVVVIKDQKEILKKGYGYSDEELKCAVDPNTTTFPIASISKLFTAIGIMQLYEQGKIDLNEDVQQYTEGIKINNPYDKKVTCSNLLTHSSGMDEGSELLGSTTDEKEIKSQETYFIQHALNVIDLPDTVCRYSNLGYNLLGYILERKSKQDYETYIKENILDKLEMTRSSVRIPDENMAKGYYYKDGEYGQVPYAYQYTSGSAGVISTAADMGNFIKALLNEGDFNGRQLLQKQTMQNMYAKEFSNDEILPGMGYGFIREERGGKLILKHEGALPGYMSTLLLIPDQNLGIYIGINTFDALPFQFEKDFLDKFLGESKMQQPTIKIADDLKRYVGNYRNYDGIAQSNIMKAFIIFDPTTQTKVSLDRNGVLNLEEYSQEKECISTRLYEIEKGKFIREDNGGYYVFRIGQDGHITYAFNEVSHNAYKRLHWYESRNILLGVIGGTIIIFVIDLVRSIIRVARKRRFIDIGNILADCCMIGGYVGTIAVVINMINQYEYHWIDSVYIMLTTILIGIAWTFIRGICYSVAMLNKKIAFRTLIYQMLIMVTCILYSSVLAYCQMIGYKII